MIWNNDDLETVDCDQCGSRECHPVITRPDGLRAVACDHCGLCYLNPRPKAHAVSRLYEADYFQKTGEAPGVRRIGYDNYLGDASRRGVEREARSRCAAVLKYTSLADKPGLEVGCATGEFCQVAEKHGARMTGLDLSLHAIQEARQRFSKIQFIAGDIEAAKGSGPYDLIFAFELIEHVLSPRGFLQSARALLRNDGILVLTTPNYACGKRVGAARWFGFNTSFEHLYFLDPESLGALAEQSGLAVVDWLTDRTTGLVPAPSARPVQHAARDCAKKVLDSVGLLDLARSAKDSIPFGPEDYTAEGTGHNLLMILKVNGAR